MNFLFDASAILNAIKQHAENSIFIFKKQYTINLDFYEMGNAVWKLVYREISTEEEAFPIINTIKNLWQLFNIISLKKEDLNDILQIAIKDSLTFYDASYLYYAIKNKIILVSDDKKLRKTAESYVTLSINLDILPYPIDRGDGVKLLLE